MSSDPRILPAGDPITGVPTHPTTEEKRLAELEERYRHEILDDEEHAELRDLILRLRRRLGR